MSDDRLQIRARMQCFLIFCVSDSQATCLSASFLFLLALGGDAAFSHTSFLTILLRAYRVFILTNLCVRVVQGQGRSRQG